MRKVRCLYFLMSLFSLISLICIGFSSWTISGTGAEVMGTGGITASPVYDVDEYATCKSIDCFTFNDKQFLNSPIGLNYVDEIAITYDPVDLSKLPTGKKLSVYFRGDGFDSAGDKKTLIFNDYQTATQLMIAGYTITYGDAATPSVKVVFSNSGISSLTYFENNNFTSESSTNYFQNSGATFKLTLDSVPDSTSKIVIKLITYVYEDGFTTNVYPLLAHDVNENGTIDENAGEIATFYSHARIE